MNCVPIIPHFINELDTQQVSIAVRTTNAENSESRSVKMTLIGQNYLGNIKTGPLYYKDQN